MDIFTATLEYFSQNRCKPSMGALTRYPYRVDVLFKTFPINNPNNLLAVRYYWRLNPPVR